MSWIDHEIDGIMIDKNRRSKLKETHILKFFILLFFCSFTFSTQLHCEEIESLNEVEYGKTISWKCSACGRINSADENYFNSYSCGHCGTSL